MRISRDPRNGGVDLALYSDVVSLQVVITQRQSLVKHFAKIDLLFLWLALAGKRKQVLHHPVGTLRLLEELGHELGSALTQAFALQQLGITENRRQRIVQFVGYTRNQLAHRRHLFAL